MNVGGDARPTSSILILPPPPLPRPLAAGEWVKRSVSIILVVRLGSEGKQKAEYDRGKLTDVVEIKTVTLCFAVAARKDVRFGPASENRPVIGQGDSS